MEAGLSASQIAHIKGQNLTTLGALAFAAGVPGETPKTVDLERIVKESPGDVVSIGTLAAICRRVFTAQTLAVSDIKSSLEKQRGPTSKSPRPSGLPGKERHLQASLLKLVLLKTSPKFCLVCLLCVLE